MNCLLKQIKYLNQDRSLGTAERLRGASVGIMPSLLRISVGLEHIDDIIAEVEHGLGKSM
jgi:O-succinylhomoserine sulfhydrylase